MRPGQRRAGVLRRRRPIASAVPADLRFVATNQRIANQASSTSTTLSMVTQRTRHIAGGPIREIVIGLMNWWVGSNENDRTTTPWFVDKIAIEIGGTAVPVTFAGARAATIAGGIVANLSDPVPATAFGMAAIPRDTEIGIRMACHYTAGSATDTFLINVDGSSLTMTNPNGAETGGFANYKGYRHAPANFIDQVDGTGALAAPTGSTATTASLPVLVLGRFAAGNAAKAVLAIGDSITGGTGDVYGSATPSAAGSGYVLRASLDGAGANAVPIMNAGRLSYPLANWANSHARRAGLAAFADIVTCALGINDIGALTVDQMKAAYLQMWADLKAASSGRVYQLAMLPSTRLKDYAIASLTTAGTTATLATAEPHGMTSGQSAVVAGATPAAYNGTKTVTVVDATTLTFAVASGTAGATTPGVLRWTSAWLNRFSQKPTGSDAVRLACNAWFATQAGAGGAIDGVIDLLPAAGDPADRTLWATNGSAGWPTVDGVHPSSAMHGLLAAAYRSAVA